MNGVVSPSWLLERLGTPRLVVVDCRPRDAYEGGRIPGARSMNVYDYFVPDTRRAGVRDLDRAAAYAFLRAGIDEADTVVFYEETTGMVSPRGLHFYQYAGFRNGAILDGGFAAWREAGGPIESGPGAPTVAVASPPRGARIPSRALARIDRTVLATADEVRGLDPSRSTLLDVRRRTEFTGEFAHECCHRAGRIDGARHLYWEDLIEGGRYRSPDAIRAVAESAGVTPDREVITYCHRGARAAAAFYALRLAGYTRVRVYIGSWHEWANEPGYPLVTG